MGARVGLAAVLFDMDGTLLDSERLWKAAQQALAAHLGGVLSGRAREEMIGRNAAESMAIFYRDLGLSGRDPHADDAWLVDRMAELFATDLHWRPGAAELVAEVRAAGLPTALVTSTSRRLVEVAQDSLLGRDTFGAVVTADDVGSPKPDPESYLTAAARLRVPITRSVVIEDSPTGIASALAAGAVVVGIPSEAPLPRLDGAQVVDSLVGINLRYLRDLVTKAR